jgi:uncharacterized protein YdaL
MGGFKKSVRIWTLGLSALVLILMTPSIALAAANGSEMQSPHNLTVVFYHANYQNEQVRLATLYNLVARFSSSITTMNVDQPITAEKETQIRNATSLIYLANRTGTDKLTSDWKSAIGQSNARFYNLGGSLANFVSHAGHLSTKLYMSSFSLSYKGRNYSLESMISFNQIMVPTLLGVHSKVLAWAMNGSGSTPYIEQIDGLGHFQAVYDCAFYSGFGVMGYIFADSLFEFYHVTVPIQHQVYIRIEDVHPLRSPDTLMGIAQFLYREHVPYMVAVIPIYKDDKVEVSLSQKPKLAAVLRYMQAHGGSIVMHGDTHQFGAYQSGEAFEFWDPFTKEPVPNEAVYDNQKLKQGLHILLENGLYPIGFEPPHYGMTATGYQVLSHYFSTLVGQVQVTKSAFVTQGLPYVIDKSYESGLNIFPENSGYVDAPTPDYIPPYVIPKLLSNVKRTFIVRDSIAGLFFHPYLPLSALSQLVSGLEKMNITFFNAKDYENFTKTPWGNISTQDGVLQQNISVQIVQPTTENKVRSWTSFYATWIITAVVTLSIVSFMVLLIRTRRRRALLLFEERGRETER